MIARALSVFALAMAVPIGAAISQSTPAAPVAQPRTVSLRVDNDAFDFWQLPWNRPDDEYTSGVHLDYDGGGAPFWARFIARNAGTTCRERLIACSTQRIELGQDIYTPATSTEDPIPAPGSRPDAGWLYLAQTARVLTPARSDETTITLGVTGRPSLAQFTQSFVHGIAPSLNRPIDWTNQLGFELGVIARYEQKRRWVALNAADVGWDFLPHAGASVGNVSDEADAGFETRVGWRLPHPWLPSAHATSVTLLAGASEHVIAYDLFLDGRTFSSGPRVGHEPLVTSGELGLELRYGRFMLEYRAQSDSRAYSRGPAWHPWGSMAGAVTFDR